MIYIILAIVGGFLTIMSMVVNAGLGKSRNISRNFYKLYSRTYIDNNFSIHWEVL